MKPSSLAKGLTPRVKATNCVCRGCVSKLCAEDRQWLVSQMQEEVRGADSPQALGLKDTRRLISLYQVKLAPPRLAHTLLLMSQSDKLVK